MTVKILVIMIILKLALSRPDPAVTEIQIHQFVGHKLGSKHVGDDLRSDHELGSFHVGDDLGSEYDDKTPTVIQDRPLRRNCVFGGTAYPTNTILPDVCLVLKCRFGNWEPNHKINEKNCKRCSVTDDPKGDVTYPTDPTNTNVVLEQRVTVHPYEKHAVPDEAWYQLTNGTYAIEQDGNYAITQYGFSHDAGFGVNADFILPDSGKKLKISSVTYYEPGLTLIIKPQASNGIFHPSVAIKVGPVDYPITTWGSVNVLSAITGTVLVYNNTIPKFPGKGHKHCINIVGSRGLSVRICSDRTHYLKLYVWAMKSLLEDEVYGLCDTITGYTIPKYYTDRNGTHQTDSKEFTPTWTI